MRTTPRTRWSGHSTERPVRELQAHQDMRRSSLVPVSFSRLRTGGRAGEYEEATHGFCP